VTESVGGMYLWRVIFGPPGIDVGDMIRVSPFPHVDRPISRELQGFPEQRRNFRC